MQLDVPAHIARALPFERTDGYDFDYPPELVARYPAEPRASARLMVVDRASGGVRHERLSDLPAYFGPGDVLVANDTMVYPARFRAEKERTGAQLEVFLVRELHAENLIWDVLVDPARKVRPGNMLRFAENVEAEVLDITTARGRTLRFLSDGTPADLHAWIDRVGETPLPPYLRRAPEPADKVRYQTIFARHRGAVVAPSAGLHFTPGLLAGLRKAGADVLTVTLHTGLGSFQAIEVEDVSKHRMGSEAYAVSPDVAARVNAVLEGGATTVTACDPTVVRALESTLTSTRRLKPSTGWTDKFIHAPHDFHVAQRLLTNFHRPRTPLLVLVAAFCGYDLMRHAYEEAVRNEYRLFSFGDAMLIL